MASKHRLTLEYLEDRLAPAVGSPWPDSQHLTLSLMPDGTHVGTQTSQLFRTLNAQMPTRQWETQILRAFQTWAANANLNIGLVADGGQPAGAAGPVQGDPRFGDIRIASLPLSPEMLAVALPFDTTTGTWAGDV